MSGSSGIALRLQASSPMLQEPFAAKSTEDRVVDQPGRPDPGGDSKKRAGCGYFDGLQCRPLNELDIVDADRGLSSENRTGGREQRPRVALTIGHELLDTPNRSDEHKGLRAFPS